MSPRTMLAATVLGLVTVCLGLGAVASAAVTAGAAAPAGAGVPVQYRLPADGPLPRTWRVTLAIVRADNPDWIISQFAAGVPRTVTTENKGEFSETWDGLDDNFMPVPPGSYGVKGICMPATKWDIDGEYHSVVPKWNGAADAWMAPLDQPRQPQRVDGDPCEAPLGDVDVAPGGIGVFYFTYLENAVNNFLTDFRKPIGYDQILASYGSGGAAGGSSTCTDGTTIWSFSTDGGPKFVFRADGRPFGKDSGSYRRGVYLPKGWVTGLDAWRDAAAGKSYVYVAERGRIADEVPEGKTGKKRKVAYHESATERVNRIVILDGVSATQLASIDVAEPLAVIARADRLVVLHGSGAEFAVSAMPLHSGLPAANEPLKPLFTLPAGTHPFDLELDSRGNFYISDPTANKVHKFSPDGKLFLSIGRLAAQAPGTYDPLTLMAPAKLAAWTDADGQDRIVIVEAAGPNRCSEWSADGKLIREWLTPQTRSNSGYAIDPQASDRVYILGQRGWLTRFRVDYATGVWHTDAVWPDVGAGRFAANCAYPKVIYRGATKYLAFGRNYVIYRLAGERWLPSAAILRERSDNRWHAFAWHDANGDGEVQEAEYKDQPMQTPPGTLRYWGETWLDDLSLVAMGQETTDCWRLAPSGFDAHGNPVFDPKGWKKLLTDPVFAAKQAGKADALFGGNEAADSFNSDWAMINGSMADGFYINARGGKNFSANFGAQIKVSRYVPDGQGGFKLKWRTGRAALLGNARPGEMYGSIFVTPPTNGIVGVTDNSRAGYVLYTEDGLYVDTLFADPRVLSREQAGTYLHGGEFFAGKHYLNRDNGKVYIAFGKIMPMLYEVVGWGAKETPVRALASVDRTVTITAGQIAPPPEIALRVRGGAGTARVAWLLPATGGGPALDGSMTGWEASAPVQFQADAKQSVEVRCLYDPQNLYLRWHARLGRPFTPRDLQPAERLFTHDRAADTLSFYFQGDPSAPAPKGRDGRAGDVRFVFGIFKDGAQVRPVVLGMYPKAPWTDAKPAPLTYRTPVGTAVFEHVALVPGVRLAHQLDADGQGFVIAAALPRTAVMPKFAEFSGGLRTMVDFEATFGGHGKFWWSDADGAASRETFDEPSEAALYPGSWAPAEFRPLGDRFVVRAWSAIGPWGGPGAEGFHDGDEKMKNAIRDFFAKAKYPPDEGEVNLAQTYGGVDAISRAGRGPLRWATHVTDGDDEHLALGQAGQLFHLATWIYVPADMKLECTFVQPWPMNLSTVRVSEEGMPLGEQLFRLDSSGKQAAARQVVDFRKGWNRVLYRGHCFGYQLGFGLVIHGTPEQLWQLKSSPVPPK